MSGWPEFCATVGKERIYLLVALANAEDWTRSIQENLEEAGSEQLAGKRIPVNAQGDEACA
jgi:hypothetical protein